jgi:hypothetical protein
MEREGDLGGEEIQMQIDAAATAHIMSVLTDLYSDPILAVVREYSTNALDAHIEVGQTKPIEVTTPTAMSPFFKVKDYGVGLDVDAIRRIYSQYGASTKRDSNDFNGVLGLGCKSALTYTNQFTVTSVKDGDKTIVSVSRSQDGGGVMQVVSITKTAESNFTEVTVPTRDQKFAIKAKEFFRFWKKGTVLLDGVDPTGLPKDAKEIGPGLYMVPNLDDDYVVMGNVAYPTEHALYKDYRGYGNMFGVVAYVAMGRVNFTPSRETLHMTTRTTEELNRIRREFKDALHSQMRKDIEDAPSFAEAYKRYSVWHTAFRGQNVPNVYRGVTIPNAFSPTTSPDDKPGHKNVSPWMTTYMTGRSRYSVSEHVRHVSIQDLQKAVVISDYDGLKITPRLKEKMSKWAEDNGGYSAQFILTSDKQLGRPWVEARTVDWQTIRDIKLPRNVNARPARKAPYDVIQPGGGIKQDSNITGSPILFVGPTESILQDSRWGYKGVSNVTREALQKALPGATIVVLGVNRHEKFKRDYPTAQHVREYAKTYLTTTFDALTEDDKLWLGAATDTFARANISKLDKSRILDPQVSRYIDIVTKPTNARIEAYQAAKTAARKFSLTIPDVAPVTDPMKRYPLADSSAISYHKDHVYTYMNAVFQALPSV